MTPPCSPGNAKDFKFIFVSPPWTGGTCWVLLGDWYGFGTLVTTWGVLVSSE